MMAQAKPAPPPARATTTQKLTLVSIIIGILGAGGGWWADRIRSEAESKYTKERVSEMEQDRKDMTKELRETLAEMTRLLGAIAKDEAILNNRVGNLEDWRKWQEHKP